MLINHKDSECDESHAHTKNVRGVTQDVSVIDILL